jgi:hypothetical protein
VADVARGRSLFKAGRSLAYADRIDERSGGMKVGLFINTQYPEGTDVPALIPELIEQVRVARDSGFKSLWFPHHWLTEPMQMLQIMPAMAFLATEASWVPAWAIANPSSPPSAFRWRSEPAGLPRASC